ncbi:MAG: SNF2-related protein, partial [Candidatus Hinthialibacter sp.]
MLVICPASLRKQWNLEIQEKFNIPNVVLDAPIYRQLQREGINPYEQESVVITSFNFVSRNCDEFQLIPWDLVVIDEAHKLRNVYRPSNKIGKRILQAIGDRRKILLTATPLQNSLLELYGLSTFIDQHIFGEVNTFRYQYTAQNSDLIELKKRLSPFCKRTLRSQVTEYIPFTKRFLITERFKPTDREQNLYEAVSTFLSREDTYSIPHQQRHLTTLIIRKLLASSSYAISGTLETLKFRLNELKGKVVQASDLPERLFELEDIDDEYLDEILMGSDEEKGDDDKYQEIDFRKLNEEIDELERYIRWAQSIGTDTKTRSLLHALKGGFSKMEEMGAARKALIFTESRRTQDYLKQFLEANGYAGDIVLFNGSNSGPETKSIYEAWLEKNRDTGRVTQSKNVDIRTALVEYFRDSASIMIATEAAAEGINLQFCSLVINYDLPWNPQRIEQRIGRCHRYGQKHDVVVVNFLNERNEADQRVYELLDQKFHLFSGLFGASDEVLGSIESGVDFEKRILAIYQQCRSREAIEEAFKQLQTEMDEMIQSKIAESRKILLEHFDEDVHARLRFQLDSTREQLDRMGDIFWKLTRFILEDSAEFEDTSLSFLLHRPPNDSVKRGRYFLISKNKQVANSEFLYRLSHPLGEYVLDCGKDLLCPPAEVVFDYSNHPVKISVVESLVGKTGWLILQRLIIDSFEREEYLLFSALDDQGNSLGQEVCEKLFHCRGDVHEEISLSESLNGSLKEDADRHVQATISRSLELNNQHFREECDRLDKWADDKVKSIEKELSDTKERIKALNRQARLAAACLTKT